MIVRIRPFYHFSNRLEKALFRNGSDPYFSIYWQIGTGEFRTKKVR